MGAKNTLFNGKRKTLNKPFQNPDVTKYFNQAVIYTELLLTAMDNLESKGFKLEHKLKITGNAFKKEAEKLINRVHNQIESQEKELAFYESVRFIEQGTNELIEKELSKMI